MREGKNICSKGIKKTGKTLITAMLSLSIGTHFLGSYSFAQENNILKNQVQRVNKIHEKNIPTSYKNSEIALEEIVNPPLSIILKKAAEYCTKLSNATLDFICTEIATERLNYDYKKGDWFVHKLIERKAKNNFIYDYQLVRKDKKVKEKRILLNVNGKKIHYKNAHLITQRFDYARVIFGPIGVLGESWQKHFEYKILGSEILNKTDTFVIQASPKNSQKIEHLYGKIWISKKDYNILKIEWSPQSLKNYEYINRFAKSLRAKPKLTLVSEYFFEKNNIRFPSSYFIKEDYFLKGQNKIQVISKQGLRKVNKFTMSEIEVKYKDYKFFIVETEVKYEK